MVRCKFQSEAITATAKHFGDPDSGVGPRKRRRLSLSTAAGDEEEQDDAEPIGFEVSCNISSCQFNDSEYL